MRQLMGILFAIIGLILTTALMNSGNNTPVVQWPSEGFHNLVFSIGWLSPFPDALVYIIAVLVIALIAFIFYKIGTGFYHLVAR